MTDEVRLSSRNSVTLTDDEIMNAAITAADELDATRVSEMRGKGWHATTIFDGDTGLLRLGRLVEKALLAKMSVPSEMGQREKLLAKACDAAFAFIDSHAADPDLTVEMCIKYATYKEARRELEGTP